MIKKCREMMTPAPACCLPFQTVDKAAQIMKEEDVGAIPIIENALSMKPIGIVTDRDIALKMATYGFDAKNTTVDRIMSHDPLVCNEDDDVEFALYTMAEHRVRRIPVINRNGEIIGIIAQGDLALRMKEPIKMWEVVKEISKHSEF
jgi:CBS domain-containing protein